MYIMLHYTIGYVSIIDLYVGICTCGQACVYMHVWMLLLINVYNYLYFYMLIVHKAHWIVQFDGRIKVCQ